MAKENEKENNKVINLGGSLCALSASPDGKHIVAAGRDGFVFFLFNFEII